MSKITILGGTGYTGTNIAREAVARGHEVTSFSRNAPAEPVDGVRYLTGDVEAELDTLIDDADVLVGSIPPRGEFESKVTGLYDQAIARAAESGTRLVVIGGWSALRLSPDATRTAYTDAVPEAFAAEAKIMAEVVDTLVDSAPEKLDWVYVSPAATYGSYNPGEAKGEYRTGGEVAIFDADGNSNASGVDFALAVVDEIESPKFSRQQFGVAY